MMVEKLWLARQPDLSQAGRTSILEDEILFLQLSIFVKIAQVKFGLWGIEKFQPPIIRGVGTQDLEKISFFPADCQSGSNFNETQSSAETRLLRMAMSNKI